jgi:hypothetical protein
MMNLDQYMKTRENYRLLAIEAESQNNIEQAEYLTGVIRGLDLAFEYDYTTKTVKIGA